MAILDNKIIRYVFIILLIESTTFLGHRIDVFAAPYAALFVGAGFSISMYYIFGKDALIPIIFGLIIGHPVARVFIYDEDVWLSVVYGFILVGLDVFITLSFIYAVKKYYVPGQVTFSNWMKFIGIILIASVVFSLLASSFELVIFPDIDFIFELLYNFFGEAMGIGIFSVVLINSVHYEGKDFKDGRPLWLNAFFISVSSFLMFLLLYPTSSEFTYFSYSYFVIIIFFLSSIVFGFRTLSLLSVIYVIFVHIFYIPNLEVNQGYKIFLMNTFLLSSIIISTISRIIMIQLQRKNNEVESTNVKLEDMIESTFSLLKLGEEKHFKAEIDNSLYMLELFQIAKKIFKNYDRASCYMRGEEFVHFIDAIGYDLETLNNFRFRIEDFQWDLDEPLHVVNSSKLVKVSMKGNYENYVERTGAVLGESIIFCFFLDNGQVGGMSFDIDEGSQKKFIMSDFENYKSFQRIMNSFHSTRVLITKNNTLRNDIVLSLIRTLELYDQYTGGHSEEVANLSYMIAKQMGLSEDILSNVYWAGIVHDIGKVGIPSEILNKPTKLSLEEYDTIKAHPGFGYEILKRSEDLGHIADLVKHHHEWWNGSGYPDQLAGDQIPLEARIIGVCDAVSSMATKRPYTEIKTSNEIIQELERYSGTQFAPDIAKEMVKFIQNGELDKFYLSRR